MPESKIYVGDIGTAIILDCGSNISSASVHQIKYKKPSGVTGVWDATIVDDTHIQHITESGDLDEGGYSANFHYSVQAYIELVDWQGHGELAEFFVYPVI